MLSIIQDFGTAATYAMYGVTVVALVGSTIIKPQKDKTSREPKSII